MLLMVEKGICHSIYCYVKGSIKYKKDYEKNADLLYIQYWDENDLYGRKVSEKLPVNKLAQIKDSSQLNQDLIKR